MQPAPTFPQSRCDAWNAAHPVGTRVIVKMDSGRTVETRTTTEAQTLGGHSAVIWLEGVSGCYLLGHVTALDDIADITTPDSAAADPLPPQDRPAAGGGLPLPQPAATPSVNPCTGEGR